MRVVLQRVNSAKVEVDGAVVGSIDRGLVVFLGIAEEDDCPAIQKMVDKISRLRIFADPNGKTNLSSKDVSGEILIISQFTLMAECESNRPSFSRAANATKARELYEFFIKECQGKFAKVASGQFAAHMHVFCHNDGPFTLSFS